MCPYKVKKKDWQKVSLYVKDETLNGVIHFENVDFSRIQAAEKEILLKLEKLNKVVVRKGCINIVLNWDRNSLFNKSLGMSII